jgi:hypothetical protein
VCRRPAKYEAGRPRCECGLRWLDQYPREAQVDTHDRHEIAQRLAQLLRQREVLKEQAELIGGALAGIRDQIELLRAEASAAGVVLTENAE